MPRQKPRQLPPAEATFDAVLIAKYRFFDSSEAKYVL